MKKHFTPLWLAFASSIFSHGIWAEPTTTNLSIDLTIDSPNWQSLEYGKLPANQLEQTESGLRIKVDGSASPLIYVFNQATDISHIKVTGLLKQLPVMPEGKTQGDKGADDFAFRIGLVIAGDKQLGFAQRLIAPNWVKTLYGLAPKGTGISHIQFLNLANVPGPNWTTRTHPASKGLFQEHVVSTIDKPGEFSLDHQIGNKVKVIAFWISSDGDDTNSRYELDLTHISYR